MVPVVPAVPAAATLPSWMYADPAVVVERIEENEVRVELRRQQREAQQQRVTFGLVGEGTVRLIKRARIRELVAGVLGKKR